MAKWSQRVEWSAFIEKFFLTVAEAKTTPNEIFTHPDFAPYETVLQEIERKEKLAIGMAQEALNILHANPEFIDFFDVGGVWGGTVTHMILGEGVLGSGGVLNKKQIESALINLIGGRGLPDIHGIRAALIKNGYWTNGATGQGKGSSFLEQYLHYKVEFVSEPRPRQSHLWSRNGTLVVSGSSSSNAMASQKQYTVKIFDQDGTTFLTNISPRELGGVPTFTSKIYGGFSDIKINLRGERFQFDSFGEGTLINFMNIVEIEVVDENNPRGRTIYKGWISQYEPYVMENGDEGVTITILHLTSLLSASYYKNGASYTVEFTEEDAETMGRAVIDHFNTIFSGALLSYSAATTDPVGTSLTQDFVDKKWFDALTTIGDLCGTDWWWKIDETGQYWLKAKPGTATHTFTIGKDAAVVRATKNMEGMVNDVQVRYTGAATLEDDDATSQASFGTGSPATGKWTKIVSDSNIGDVTTATARAAKEIEDNKAAKIMATLTINNQYDLESIKVGQTCKIRNFDKDNSFFNDNMMIAQLTYSGDAVTIQLSNEPINFALQLNKFVNG